MKNARKALLASGLLLAPMIATSQESFMDWMAEAANRRAAALGAVDLYLRIIDFPGLSFAPPGGDVGQCTGKICQGFAVEPVTLPNGIDSVEERPLSPEELAVLAGVSASALGALGSGMLMAQDAINEQIGMGPDAAIQGLMSPLGASDDPLAQILSPNRLVGIGGMMALSGAAALREAEQSLATSNAAAQANAEAAFDIYSALSPAGSEALEGVPTNLYRATGLEQTMDAGEGGQFTLHSASVWVDPQNDVVVRQRLEGTAESDGAPRDFFMEIAFSDFRNPPGCGAMIEPYRRVMRMGGILDETQTAELEEARAQLAEFEQQLASMPAQQRQMMERMMGSQMDMMRNLVNGGAIEFVEETEQVLCNPDLAEVFSVGQAPEAGDALVRQAQQHLATLGYDVDASGVLDTRTTIAVSQFQAERDLEVSGEVTPQLVGMLAAAVDAQ